ncbi:GH3 auxin-responsive promoter family protein [Kutzneria buriramensis]|uniref:GH3 auxin-responsive promoter family protein n=1 Tax=Kutzneria buriramensis TaxID=1045776 RepID=UPI001B87F3AA|nr:GH3 auxin-responsive promoter family protein [Kutzneria buriramensis]
MAAVGNAEPCRKFVNRTRDALLAQQAIYQRPGDAAESVFMDILAGVAPTAFGAEHGLTGVATLDGWKKAVPIRGYDELAPYVRRQLAGERRVLTLDDPYAFLKTSGTTGSAKLVPTTGHWRRKYRGPALYAQWGLYFDKLGGEPLPAGSVLDLSWEPAPVRFRENGFPVYSITERPVTDDVDDWLPPWRHENWFARDPVARDLADSLYGKLLRLAGADVRLIVSVNPSKIVMLAETLRANADRLIGDVGPDLGKRLARRLAGDSLRLTDLWPSLRLLVCWNSASAGLYGPWLAQVAPDVPTLPFSTTGTEGIVTLPVDGHESAGPLAVNQGLFEFVPWTDLHNGDPLPADADTVGFEELAVGEKYRLVMSQANGLYRYDVGDVYQVVGRVGATPRLEFLGRAGFQSSFTGEKVTESDVHAAVTSVIGLDLVASPRFTGIPMWDTPPYYLLAIECTDGHEAGDLGRRVDAALQDVNVEYAEKRRSGRLRPVRVLTLVPGAFRRLAEHRFHGGVATAQIKHHWLQRDSAFLGKLQELGLIADVSVCV